MIERYYYGRDKKSHAPLVTVCLISTEDGIARGISVCSLSDQPSKKIGRKLASQRAVEAIAMKASTRPVHATERKYIRNLTARSNKMRRSDSFYQFRSEFNPILSGFEGNLFVKAEAVKED